MEDQAPSFTVNEFVGSIISLDKCEYNVLSMYPRIGLISGVYRQVLALVL